MQAICGTNIIITILCGSRYLGKSDNEYSHNVAGSSLFKAVSHNPLGQLVANVKPFPFVIKEGNAGTREGRVLVRFDQRYEFLLFLGFPQHLQSVVLDITHDNVLLIVHHHLRWMEEGSELLTLVAYHAAIF